MLEEVQLRRILVLDIETVPQYPSFLDVPEHYRTLWEHKTQFQRKEGQTAAEFYSRGGIWAEFGKVVCISAGVFACHGDTICLRIKSFCDDDEKSLLNSLIALLNKQPADLTLCAHNGKEFDFPYLCRRMLINDLPIPAQLRIRGKKPWEVLHLDTLDLWKFGDYKNYTSLDLLAAAFGIPSPKSDINGSDVHRVYWEEHDLKRIKTYCENDVLTTSQLILRFKGLPLLSSGQIIIVD